MSRIERWVDVPGGRLWAREDGAGPPVVLLHAGIADGTIWDPFVPRLTGAGYRAVWYDQRGYGQSETEDVEYRRVDDLRAVLDAFGIGRACIVGNSLGGMVALDLAVSSPERVAAAVLLASGIGGLEVELSERDKAVEARYEEIDAAGDIETLTDWELGMWGSGINQPPDRLAADLRAVLRPMILASNDPDRVTGRQVPLDPPAAERLDRARMPVLFVHGALDFNHTEAFGRHLEAHLPNARFVIYPGVAHMIALEEPAQTAQLILDLIRPLGRFG